MKLNLEFFHRFFIQFPGITFHGNTSESTLILRTDGHDEANRRFFATAYAPKTITHKCNEAFFSAIIAIKGRGGEKPV